MGTLVINVGMPSTKVFKGEWFTVNFGLKQLLLHLQSLLTKALEYRKYDETSRKKGFAVFTDFQ